MNKQVLPEANDWNHYWGLDQTKRFAKVSWSKKRILKVLERYVIDGKMAVDAGCGSGFFSKYFIDKNLKTYSLDYADKALEMARQATDEKSHVIKCNFLENDLPSLIEEKADVIFSDGLFEHFTQQDQDRIMANFKSILSTDGFIVTFVPNRWSPWELIRPLFMPGIKETPFILKELVDLHERNGFSVVEQGGINTFPFVFSPDQWCGSFLGMLLYTVAKQK